ncbi:hypothetical protein DRJ22_00525 [Candidatus Woesearchaeota archaeon]|nr:MAG: hypothetical protein B6U93_00180 [Candidatus Woesearchaeota archaeon ex4484_78]RLE46977.1 MAG: hypothetical protein DRJ22_00525 [Candidatus Woesearchaeota archaeon]
MVSLDEKVLEELKKIKEDPFAKSNSLKLQDNKNLWYNYGLGKAVFEAAKKFRGDKTEKKGYVLAQYEVIESYLTSLLDGDYSFDEQCALLDILALIGKYANKVRESLEKPEVPKHLKAYNGVFKVLEKMTDLSFDADLNYVGNFETLISKARYFAPEANKISYFHNKKTVDDDIKDIVQKAYQYLSKKFTSVGLKLNDHTIALNKVEQEIQLYDALLLDFTEMYEDKFSEETRMKTQAIQKNSKIIYNNLRKKRENPDIDDIGPLTLEELDDL